MALAIKDKINKVSPWSFMVACIIPVYKEPMIGMVLAKFDKPYVDEVVVIIDEYTEDIKASIKVGLKHAKVPIKMLINKVRRGIGYAIRLGLYYALKKGYDVVVIMAGNGKDDPREIPLLLKLIEKGYDYIQGSRYLKKQKIELPLSRKIFNKLWPLIWTLITGVRHTEITNGFRAYKLEIIKNKEVNIDQEWLNHYALEYYIHYKALKLGYKYAEAPVTKKYPWTHKGGYSKIKPWKDWWHILLPPLLLWFGIRK